MPIYLPLIYLWLTTFSTITDANRCNEGLTYWCKNISSADECGAVEYCMKTVWRKVDTPGDENDSDSCTLCRDIVYEIKLLQSTDPRSVAYNYISQACNLMPDDYSKQKLLDSDVKSTAICKIFEICADAVINAEEQNSTANILQTVVSDMFSLDLDGFVDCQICKEFVSVARKEVKDSKQQGSVQRYMRHECHKKGGIFFRKACEKVFKKIFPILIHLTDQKLGGICASTKLCSSHIESSSMPPVQPALVEHTGAQTEHISITETTEINMDRSHFIECRVCKRIKSKARDMVKDNKKQRAAEAYMKQACQKSAGPLVEECEKVVEKVFPAVISMIEDELKHICSLAKICRSSYDADSPPSLNGLPLFEQGSLASLAPIASTTDWEPYEAGCDIGKQVVTLASDLMRESGIEEVLVAATEHYICPMINDSTTQCKIGAQKHINKVVGAFKDFLNSEEVCYVLALYKSSSHQLTKNIKSTNKGPVCRLCELIMSHLEKWIGKAASKTTIIHAMEEVCKILPGNLHKKCEHFISHYGSLIIKYITEGLRPFNFHDVYVTDRWDKDERCKICSEMFNFLNTTLTATGGALANAVSRNCRYLPDDISEMCDAMAYELGVLMANWLHSYAVPQEICKSLGECK